MENWAYEKSPTPKEKSGVRMDFGSIKASARQEGNARFICYANHR